MKLFFGISVLSLCSLSANISNFNVLIGTYSDPNSWAPVGVPGSLTEVKFLAGSAYTCYVLGENAAFTVSINGTTQINGTLLNDQLNLHPSGKIVLDINAPTDFSQLQLIQHQSGTINLQADCLFKDVEYFLNEPSNLEIIGPKGSLDFVNSFLGFSSSIVGSNPNINFNIQSASITAKSSSDLFKSFSNATITDSTFSFDTSALFTNFNNAYIDSSKITGSGLSSCFSNFGNLTITGNTEIDIFGVFASLSSGTVNLQNGSVTIEEQSSLLGGCQTGIIAGGTLTNAYFLGLGVQDKLIFTDNSIINNNAFIGPCPIFLNNAEVINNGIVYLDKISLNASPTLHEDCLSVFSGGTFSGGTVYLAGSLYQQIPLEANSLYIGQGINFGTITYPYLPGSLFSSATITANLANISTFGKLFSSSTIDAKNIKVQGYISPGNETNPVGTLSIIGELDFTSDGIVEFHLDSSGNDAINIFDGTLTIDPGATLVVNATNDFLRQPQYVLFNFNDGSKNLLSGTYSGFFTLQTTPNITGSQLIYNNSEIILIPGAGSFLSFASNPNTQEVATVLDELNGNTNDCLQNKIEAIIGSTPAQITSTLNQLQNSEFKGQQIVFEETIFNINDQISSYLYCYHEGYKPFGIFGYQRIVQDSFNQYNGFRSNAGYELLGFTLGSKLWQGLFSVGALETGTNYRNFKAKSSSASILMSAGLSRRHNHFNYGFEGLFGYHFIHTSRSIDLFNLKALSNHKSYSLKGQFHLEYEKNFNNILFVPYEELAYYYGSERGFHEHGASCLNLETQTSHRNLLRNTLGFKVYTNTKKPLKRRIHVIPWINLSWVYENRYRANEYLSSFINTEPVMEIDGIYPAKNFVKILAGLKAHQGMWDWTLNFNGMFGKRFYDVGCNFNIDRKF